MAKTIFEEMGGTYVRQGEYNLPCLSLPAEKENKPIGVWGQRHLHYLKQHRKVLYTNLLTSGKLNSYLADIDKQAEDMFLRLVEQIAEVFLFGQYWCMGIQHFVYFLTVFFKYKAVFLAIHIFFKVGKIGKQITCVLILWRSRNKRPKGFDFI